jgi:hypothetical protein
MTVQSPLECLQILLAKIRVTLNSFSHKVGITQLFLDTYQMCCLRKHFSEAIIQGSKENLPLADTNPSEKQLITRLQSRSRTNKTGKTRQARRFAHANQSLPLLVQWQWLTAMGFSAGRLEVGKHITTPLTTETQSTSGNRFSLHTRSSMHLKAQFTHAQSQPTTSITSL